MWFTWIYRMIRTLKGGKFPKAPDPGPWPTPDPTTDDMLAAVNRVRSRHGRRPLTISTCLMGQAVKFTERLNRDGHLHHRDLDQRLDICLVVRGAENVAWGQRSASEAVDDWMTSPGHRRNLLGDWRQMGWGETNRYWCIIFADRAGK